MKSLRFAASGLLLACGLAWPQVQFDPYSKNPPAHTAAEILNQAILALKDVKSMQYEAWTVPAEFAPKSASDPGRTTIIGTPGSPIQYRARFVVDHPPTVVLAVSNGDKVRISDGGELAEFPTRVMEDEASAAALPTLQMFDVKRLRKALETNNASYAGQDDIEGELCNVIGVVSLLENEFGSDTDYFWFSARTGLPRARQRFRLQKGKTRTTYKWIISNLELNPEISSEIFKYHPTEADSTKPPTLAPTAPQVSSGPEPRAGDRLPDLEVRDLEYKALSLDQLIAGKPTIVTLWAPWCGPCIGELPVFQKLVDQYGGRLQVIALGVEDSRLAFIDYAKKHREFHFTFVTDPHLEDSTSKLQRYFAGIGIPRNLYVNADGTVFDYAQGYRGDADELTRKISDWLQGQEKKR